MKKSEIEVGGEYAVVISYVSQSRFSEYAGRLAHVRVLEVDHEYETKARFAYGPNPAMEKKRGYLVELVETHEVGKAWRGSASSDAPIPAGARHCLATGREFVAPWDVYAGQLAEWRAKNDAARVERDEAARRFAAIRSRVAALGVDAEKVGDGLDNWSDKTIRKVTVPLDEMEALLDLAESREVARVA